MYKSCIQCVEHSLWLNSICFFSVCTALLRPPSSWWVLRLFPFLDFYEYCYSKQRCTDDSFIWQLHFFLTHIWWECCWQYIFNSLRNLHCIFPNGRAYCHSYQQCESGHFSPCFCRHTSLVFFHNEHSYWRRTLSHYGLPGFAVHVEASVSRFILLLIVHLFFW